MTNLKGEKAKRPTIKKRPRPTRHRHSVVAAIDDTTAVTVDLLLEIEAFTKYITGRLNNLLTIQRITKSGPHAYDKNRPAGMRVTARRK